ncbi:uncharacterized protein LOC120281069 [Dioscorea cayenensis subsp. rotundata]|uniref:Uncharacterized protein LOC120281069 n=1 Tax=Dioscorea cayennensis subsp. rotundata TaxID=55577 RepID=A0AB40CUZ3_DIOCR|nr:uncharacterized protein LOC120281069 [Dioscorea cayenensis subsp. rotundata]
MVKALQKKFKMPQLTTYSGKGDRYDHMQNYDAVMLLHGWEDAIMCIAFQLTLIEQSQKESLKDYVERFRAATLEVQDLQAIVAVSGMLQGTRSRDFQKSLSLDQPLTLGNLFNQANKFILSDNVMRHINAGNRDKKRKDRDETNDEGRKTRRGNEHRQVPKLKFENFTPLSQPYSTILASIEGYGILTFPPKCAKENLKDLSTWKHGENEKPSYSKKERYEDNKGMNDIKRLQDEGENPHFRQQASHPAIHVIIGGETLASETSSSRKAYARQAYEVNNIMKTQENEEPITFTSEDKGDVVMPHDDAMNISATIMKFSVKSILIDNGSSINLIYWNCYEKMNLSYG